MFSEPAPSHHPGWVRRLWGWHRPRPYLLPSVVMAVALVTLIASAIYLWRLDREMLRDPPDYMSWQYSEAQIQTLRLMRSAEDYRDHPESLPAFRRDFDLLIGRLNLLDSGPQARYSRMIGMARQIGDARAALLSHDPQTRELTPDEMAALEQALASLNVTLDLAGNRADLTYWAEMARQTSWYRNSMILSLGVMVAAFLALAGISLRLLISERRALAARKLEEDLRRERENSAYLRNIAAVISHQFRAPLAVIDSTAQRAMLTSDLDDTTPMGRDFGKIRLNIRKLAHFMDQATLAGSADAGRIEADLQPTDLAGVARRLCRHDMLTAHAGRLLLDLDPDVPRALCDSVLVTHALFNLIENAAKYAPGDSTITVGLHRRRDRAVLSVADQGPGVRPDERAEIFRQFRRGSAAAGQPGSGIGLWLARAVTNLQGGDLRLDQRNKTGARFELSLPLAGGDDA